MQSLSKKLLRKIPEKGLTELIVKAFFSADSGYKSSPCICYSYSTVNGRKEGQIKNYIIPLVRNREKAIEQVQSAIREAGYVLLDRYKGEKVKIEIKPSYKETLTPTPLTVTSLVQETPKKEEISHKKTLTLPRREQRK